MGVSETIVAAMIGAIATVTTALFQLFGMFRSRGKVDTKPRRGLTMRSVLAALALMTASAAGGFLYSELLKQRHSEDIRAMRAELKELKELTANAARLSEIARLDASREPEPEAPKADISPPLPVEITSVESVVYVPACRAQSIGEHCDEKDAQHIALCGTIPSYAHVRGIDLFVQPDAVQNPWEQHRVTFEQDLGGARFTGQSFEYAQDGELKALCVNFMQWSSEHPHIARMVVQYGPEEALPSPPANDPFEALEPPTVQMPAVVAGRGDAVTR